MYLVKRFLLTLISFLLFFLYTNLIFAFPFDYTSTTHYPSLGCSLLKDLMLFKLNSVQPSLRTAGRCCEPEWPDPEVA